MFEIVEDLQIACVVKDLIIMEIILVQILGE